jgi:hypothetical protein
MRVDQTSRGFLVGFANDDFHAVRALRNVAKRKWIGGDRAGRINAGALQKAANDHRLGSGSGRVYDNSFFVLVLFSHGNLSLRTIAAQMVQVHTSSELNPGPMTDFIETQKPTQEQIDDESRRMRRLRILVYLALDTIASGSLSPEEAAGMAAATRKLALDMFPGKERAFDLLYRPKFQRVMHEIYRLQ